MSNSGYDPALEYGTRPIIDLSDWEDHKENVRPLRSGRDAQRLKEIFSHEDEDRKHSILQQKKEWEDIIANYQGDDPIEPWTKYIEWAQQSFVQDDVRAVLVPLLEKCTKTLKALDRYNDDIRFVHLWLVYADCCEDPQDVFNFMNTNGIGHTHAIFYERWADVLEGRGSTAQADKVYAIATQRGAAPVDHLKRKQKQFQQRLIQKIQKNAVAHKHGSNENAAPNSSSSSALKPKVGRTALMPTSSALRPQPVVQRAPAATQVRAIGVAPSTMMRSTAAALPSANMRTAVTTGSIAASKKQPSSLSSSSSTKPKNQQQLSSCIYVDPEATDEFPSQAGGATGKWGQLAPLGQRVKENTQAPALWSQTKIVQKSSSKTKLKNEEKFTIFEDEECQ